MPIIDFEKSAIDFLKWGAQNNNANPSTFTDAKIYPYETTGFSIVPKINNFNISPEPLQSALQILTNNTSVTQSQTVKFAHKRTVTNTNTTTEGFKAGGSLKSTTKFKVKVGFLVSGEIEQSIEVTVSSEYNFSSTTTTTTTDEETWEVTNPVIVPAYSQVTATLLIMGGELPITTDLSAQINSLTERVASIRYKQYGVDYYTERSFSPAGALASQWPGRPDIYHFGPGGALLIKGEGITVSAPGLFTVVQYVETPLPGYKGETKTWYSDQITLADGSVLTVPNFNPETVRIEPYVGTPVQYIPSNNRWFSNSDITVQDNSLGEVQNSSSYFVTKNDLSDIS